MSTAHFQMMARYNQWATERLIQSLGQLSQAQLQQEGLLFFKSIFGTLNHLLVAEHLLWFSRFKYGTSEKLSLDHCAEQDVQQLFARLRESTQQWVDFVDTLSADDLDGDLSYTSTAGQALCFPYRAMLTHVFNHSTHHRGQISAAMTAMGHACPEMDLVYMLLA